MISDPSRRSSIANLLIFASSTFCSSTDLFFISTVLPFTSAVFGTVVVLSSLVSTTLAAAFL